MSLDKLFPVYSRSKKLNLSCMYFIIVETIHYFNWGTIIVSKNPDVVDGQKLNLRAVGSGIFVTITAEIPVKNTELTTNFNKRSNI